MKDYKFSKKDKKYNILASILYIFGILYAEIMSIILLKTFYSTYLVVVIFAGIPTLAVSVFFLIKNIRLPVQEESEVIDEH